MFKWCLICHFQLVDERFYSATAFLAMQTAVIPTAIPSVCPSVQNLGVRFNIYTMAEASDFKFGTQLGVAKTHHKTTPRGKVGVALG